MSETQTSTAPDDIDTTTPKRRHSYWQNQAIIRQRIIDKQDKTIAHLTASVVQLETDYDAVEAKLNEAEAKLQHQGPALKTSRAW